MLLSLQHGKPGPQGQVRAVRLCHAIKTASVKFAVYPPVGDSKLKAWPFGSGFLFAPVSFHCSKGKGHETFSGVHEASKKQNRNISTAYGSSPVLIVNGFGSVKERTFVFTIKASIFCGEHEFSIEPITEISFDVI